jgi:hypothetical protein
MSHVQTWSARLAAIAGARTWGVSEVLVKGRRVRVDEVSDTERSPLGQFLPGHVSPRSDDRKKSVALLTTATNWPSGVVATAKAELV